MQNSYAPYQHQKKRHSRIKLPFKLPKTWKKWVLLLLSIFFVIFIIFYICLGQLRFFMNHYLGLTFFSKNYVVLLQNNYELRPGGGFITGYGNIDTFMGFTSDISFKNSYDIDTESYVNPPYPHEDFLKDQWYPGYGFRDANWQAHFPDNTKELTKFYTDKFPKKEIDGFIVVNFSMIEDLVDKLGGIELNGKKIDKNNLFSELEFSVNNIDRHNVKALESRKKILSDLGAAVMKKAKYHPFKSRDVIVDALNNKDIYIWLKNNRLQKKLVKKGWSNTLVQPDNSDFLAVNLANLGSKKADRYLQTEVNYYADISTVVPQITTEVTIRYPGNINIYSDNYKGYLRLYVPKKSNFDNKPVASVEEKNDDFKVLGTKFRLSAGGKTTLTYKYSLPRTVLKMDEYKLRLIKQSGSNMLYRVIVEASKGKSLNSKLFTTLENKAVFNGYLKHDLDLNLKVLPDTIPPYPFEQEFIDLNTINIVWSESLDKPSATNIKNYTISDLNKQSKALDQISITAAKMTQDNIVQLTISGATNQNLEHYRIDMKGIRDLAGNMILPNPKSITAVQRIKLVDSSEDKGE